MADQQKDETRQHLNISYSMAHFSKIGITPVEEIQRSTRVAAQNSEITGPGDAWLCNKQLKHYPSCSKKATNITVYSFVRIVDDDKKSFLGYVVDLFKDQKGEKMVRLRPFLFGKDIEALIPELNPQSREVFITSTDLEISAEYVDGPAQVLTPSHFNECIATHPQSLSFMCHREFKNNSIKPVRLYKLRGYYAQPFTSAMGRRFQRPIVCALYADQGAVAKGKRVAKEVTTVRERLNSKLAKEHVGTKLPDSRADNVEVLSQDSGIRGCWFRCKVLRSSQKLLKVQHCDVTEVDGPGMLEEWVPKARVANPDKLGMRCVGRLTVRPWPEWDSADMRFEAGLAVDAWWCDGWWEGVITGRDISSTNNFQIYLPGENHFLMVERKYIRVSKDWINDQWVDIKSKPDIISLLNSYLNPLPKVQLPQINTTSTEVRESEGGKLKVPSSSTSEAKKKDTEDLHIQQLLKMKEKEDWTSKSSRNAAKNGVRKIARQG